MSLDFNNLGFSFDEVEKASEVSFEPVPSGVYTLQVKNVSAIQSKNNIAGRKIEFVIVDNEKFNGKKIFKNFYLESAKGIAQTKTMFGMFAGFLKSCGTSKEERELLLKSGYQPEALFVSLTEKKYSVEVGVREYEGKTYNDFVKIISFTQAGASF